CEQAARAPRVMHLLVDRDRVDQVATAATGLDRMGHTEQTQRTGLLRQLARQLTGPLPTVQVRQHLLLGEPADRGPQSPEFLGRPRRAGQAIHCSLPFSRETGRSTLRARSHSPKPLACGSNRACEATPAPRMPSTTKFTARRFGKTCRVT